MSTSEHLPPETRFVIIGAGSAGLTAARTLLEKGYRNIIVLEALDAAGGKCRSEVVEGRAYDMGAVVGTRDDNKDLLKLVRQHGLGIHDTNSGDLPIGTRPSRYRRRARTIFELFKYLKLARVNWRGVHEGEMRVLSEELCDTFAAVAERRAIRNVEMRFRPLYVGMGFGLAETIPTAYLVSFLSIRALTSVLRFGCFGIQEGFQEVWVREAKKLEQEGVQFLYNTRVVSILRGGKVTLRTRKRTGLGNELLECEKLIVACDPRQIGLDTNAAEQELLTLTRTENYRVLLCRIEGLPEINAATFYFAEQNLPAKRAGHVMILYRKFPETNIYAAYVYGGGLSRGELEGRLEQDIEAFGGSVTEHLAYQDWTYFPHFSTAALKSGVMDRLARIQNQKHTIYVGEWSVLGKVSRTMANARLMTERLIRREFHAEAMARHMTQ